MVTEKNILKNISKIRKEKGYSQDYIAIKLGMAQPGYALIERGERKLSVSRLLQIADILDVSVIKIVDIKEAEDQSKYNQSEIYERISVTFEVSPDKKEELLAMVKDVNV